MSILLFIIIIVILSWIHTYYIHNIKLDQISRNAPVVSINNISKSLEPGNIIFLCKRKLPLYQLSFHPVLSYMLDTPFHHVGILDSQLNYVHFVRNGLETNRHTLREGTSQIQSIPIEKFLTYYYEKHRPLIKVYRLKNKITKLDTYMYQGLYQLVKRQIIFEQNHLIHILNYFGLTNSWKNDHINCNLFLGFLFEEMSLLPKSDNAFREYLPLKLIDKIQDHIGYYCNGIYQLVPDMN